MKPCPTNKPKLFVNFSCVLWCCYWSPLMWPTMDCECKYSCCCLDWLLKIESSEFQHQHTNSPQLSSISPIFLLFTMVGQWSSWTESLMWAHSFRDFVATSFGKSKAERTNGYGTQHTSILFHLLLTWTPPCLMKQGWKIPPFLRQLKINMWFSFCERCCSPFC